MTIDPDDYADLFANLSPDDFDSESTADYESTPPDSDFETFIWRRVDALRYAVLASNGTTLNPVTVLANCGIERSFAPFRTEQMGEMNARVALEAGAMRATMMLFAMRTAVCVLDMASEAAYDVSDFKKSDAAGAIDAYLVYAQHKQPDGTVRTVLGYLPCRDDDESALGPFVRVPGQHHTLPTLDRILA